MRQPGTNATGLTNQAEEVHVKLLQLLKQVFPSASSVAVLHDLLNLPLALLLPALKKTGATLALNLRVIEAGSPNDLTTAFTMLKQERPDVLYVFGGRLLFRRT